ncbi:hypothetical protein CEXT_670791 [Caerostris extrusa]|uniref:Maturase K n=1 Tax=Caerostris extrusa TaxID=172846 RepID=A0AAV4U7E7_CAEEX|nr:hypothetical protein CEXT_670791 [Caerostris extrusa]
MDCSELLEPHQTFSEFVLETPITWRPPMSQENGIPHVVNLFDPFFTPVMGYLLKKTDLLTLFNAWKKRSSHSLYNQIMQFILRSPIQNMDFHSRRNRMRA